MAEEKCKKCGVGLTDENRCSCEDEICSKCCSCAEDCSCSCKEK